MLSLSDKMCWHVPYDSSKMLQKSWIVRLRSSRITSHTFATFSGVMLIKGHLQRLRLFSLVFSFYLQQLAPLWLHCLLCLSAVVLLVCVFSLNYQST